MYRLYICYEHSLNAFSYVLETGVRSCSLAISALYFTLFLEKDLSGSSDSNIFGLGARDKSVKALPFSHAIHLLLLIEPCLVDLLLALFLMLCAGCWN